MELKRKVLAYITSGEGTERKILVFENKEHPEEGWQVPGGTIEKDELLMDALYREIEEETGITRDQLELRGKVTKNKHFPRDRDLVYERNIFHLIYTGEVLSPWEHRVDSDGKDDGSIYCNRWIPLDNLPQLAGKQDEALDFI
ncbi:nudix hydrolase [Bacillus sp. OxB-1]|uniref:NUDIX hydrolase n=1 Tax=Bacillus sp. (strain OxB-1) TaxID=98228 RepID=UPI000581E8E6|nr:NUDIX domain-containing protein [Bacillus sp. OxB-1]BAQ08794.1 nudix hydrolase [Bacillus sp. OxB-1]